METKLFEDRTRVSARALFVGHRIDLRAFELTRRLAISPLLVDAGSHGCAVLFRYGVVALFGLSASEEVSFLAELKPLIIDPIETTVHEDVIIELGDESKEGIVGPNIVLREFTIERLQLIADVLSKSVVLEYYERRIAGSFDRIEPFANELQTGGQHREPGKELLRHIGDTLSINAMMVGRVEISEKPELLWEQPKLEGLYLRLESEYELRERHLSLERKLALISQTAGTFLRLLQDKRTLRVEWYIVILIFVEIIISVSKMF